MKLPGILAPVVARAKAAWAARQARERKALAAAAAVVAAALGYLAYDAAVEDEARLARQLPKQRALLARMEYEAAELEKLRGQPIRDAAGWPQRLEGAQAAAKVRGLEFRMSVEGDGLVVAGNGEYGAVVDWLGDVAQQQGLFPQKLSLHRERGAGLAVSARLESPVP